MSKTKLSGIAAALLLVGLGSFYAGQQQNRRIPTAAEMRTTEAAANAAAQRAADTESLREAMLLPVANSARAQKPYQDPRRVTSQENQTPPAGQAVDVIRRLSVQAEQGDARAALQIFQKLEQCQGALRSDLRSGIFADGVSDPGDRVQALKDIEAVTKDCQGLTDQHFSRMGYWLDKAAAGGDLLAMLRYGDTGYRYVVGTPTDMLRDPEKIVEYKRKAMGYLHQAASQGVPEAMLSLASSYQNGIVANKDPVLAYAYARAAQQVHPSGPPGMQERFLQIYSNGLSSEQLAAGNEQAQEIYRDCCNHGAK